MNKTSIATSKIFGVRVDAVGMDEAVKLVGNWMEDKKIQQTRLVFTPNVEQVMAAQKNEEFLFTLNKGDLNVCDGAGLRWGVNRLYEHKSEQPLIVERVSGIDLAESLCGNAAEGGKKVLLVGGRASVAKKAASNLRERFTGLEIAGLTGSGDVVNETEKEWKEIGRQVKGFQPSLVFVAFGAPAQEQWLVKHREELSKMGVRVGMVVGGAVDVWAGEVRRAPLSWQEMGLEWLWRLMQQPWRVRRQMKLVEFVGKVLRDER
jgi:N-acetylglucosaminyldiphosphoundecaprenol N-acetyl-beta-D-mannosaminyltransferase